MLPKFTLNGLVHKCNQSAGTEPCAKFGFTIETVNHNWLHPAKYPRENTASVILNWGDHQLPTCF